MDISYLFRGIILGFGIAAPVGPIGLLCIQRTLYGGRAVGLASGLGAATADAIYGFVAAFGLTFVSSFLIGQRVWFSLIGGLFLCYLGVRTFLALPAEKAANAAEGGLPAAYGSTFFLTLTNPPTILMFLGIFAGAGLASGGVNLNRATLLVVGVFVGSAAWWVLLSTTVSLVRSRFTAATMRWANRVAGVVIAAFGVYALASLLWV